MSGLQLSEKACSQCGEMKPLSEFHRNKDAPDGRQYKCVDCMREYVKSYQERRRREMGEEAWLAYNRRSVREHRKRTGAKKDKLQQAAWRAAVNRLRDAHPDEFTAYYREERYERGLSID